MKHPFVMSVVAATCFLASADARAAVCGSLYLDEEPQEVILGEYGPINSDFQGRVWVVPSTQLGVCWRDEGGAWNLEQIPGCDTSSSASDTFVLSTGGGDDYVAPLLESQTYSLPGANWLVAKLYGWFDTHAMRCDGKAIAPWNPNFSFGVTASMGTGADEFHGTPNNDIAASNYTSVEWGAIPTFYAPADYALDMLCGGAGDDELLGDADDAWASGYEEHLDGGPGVDLCDGDPPDGPLGGVSGSSVSDVAKSTCETVEHAYPHDGWFSCEDSENPIDTLGL